MKFNNFVLIIIIFILTIFTLLLLLLKSRKKNERYQPFSSPPPYRGPKIVGEDPFKYLILPDLTLEELNRFAHSSPENMDVVRGYLKRIHPSLTLSALNKGVFFKEDNITRPETLYKRYKRMHKNKPEDVLQHNVKYRYNYLNATRFYLQKIIEIFSLLGAEYIQSFTIPGDEEIEDKNIALIDFSNLPITSKTFNEKFLEGKDLAIKLIKEGDSGIRIKVFIHNGEHRKLNERLRKINKEIEKFNERDNKAYLNYNIINTISRVFSEKGFKEIGDNFTFNFPQIILSKNRDLNFEELKKFFLTKRSTSEWILNEDIEDDEDTEDAKDTEGEKIKKREEEKEYPPPTQEDVSTFLNNLKMASSDTITNFLRNISEKDIKKRLKEILSYIRSENYDKYRDMFDRDIFRILQNSNLNKQHIFQNFNYFFRTNR